MTKITSSFSNEQLKAIIERIERLEEEKKTIAADIKEVYAEAKGNGFDVKLLRKVVSIRKQDANERAEEEAMLDVYLSALGMQSDLFEHDLKIPPRAEVAFQGVVDRDGEITPVASAVAEAPTSKSLTGELVHPTAETHSKIDDGPMPEFLKRVAL